jgi:hypothetical protein
MNNVLSVRINDDGINMISFHDKAVKKNTRAYRPFLMDLLDAFDDIHGSD